MPDAPETNRNQRLTLVVTGSIAAIKTIPLISALSERCHEVTVILTRAPEQWEWVSGDAAKAATGHAVITHTDNIQTKANAIMASRTILIAPASADFISQLAHASSELAHKILEAQRHGSKLILAPAMNYKMWQHPTVQRNCATLAASNITILGPVKGIMACGDNGYGRMIEVSEMASGVQAALAGIQHPSASHYDAARHDGMKEIPFRPTETGARILIALTDGGASLNALNMLVFAIDRARLTAEYIVDPHWAKRRAILEGMTKKTIVSDHFQLPDLEGLEHIKLPERARCVFFPFLDKTLAEKMVQGQADTLCLSTYLASKTPIVTTAACLQNLPPALAKSLCHDGVLGIERYNDLAQILPPQQFLNCTPR